MNTHFKHSVAIITGGASGIGKALVLQLAAKGAVVIVVGRNKKKGLQFVKTLQSEGHEAVFEQVDMTREKAVAGLLKRTAKTYGRIDYFFNNAGTYLGGEMRDTPLKNWHEVHHNNVVSVMNGSYYAYRYMLKQGSGHIINVASAAGLFPAPILGVYGATKFEIVGLTHSLRIEAKKLGVRVSAACPTVVDTPLYDGKKQHKFDIAKVLGDRRRLQTADTAAKRILRGVSKNKATIHTSAATHAVTLVYRFIPVLYFAGAQRIVHRYRTTLREDG